MAASLIRDPNNPKYIEDERRRRQMELDQQGVRPGVLPKLVGRGLAAVRDAASTYAPAIGAVSPFAGAIADGAGAVHSAPVAPPVPAPSTDFSHVQGGTSDFTNLKGTQGLYRIVKTGPGTYTQVPVDGPAPAGENRYYGQDGSRLDTKMSKPAFAQENAADNVLDMTQSINRQLVAQRAGEGLTRVARMQDEGAQRNAAADFARMDPSDQGKLKAALAKEQGDNARAQLDYNGKLAIAGANNNIAKGNLALAGMKTQLGQDNRINDILNKPETQAAGINEILRNLQPGEFSSLLEQNDPRALAVYNMVTQKARDATGNADFSLGQADRNSGFFDRLFSSGDYDANNNLVRDTSFNAADLGGVPNEVVDAAIAYDQRRKKKGLGR
jgi:hypothetical protein